ncbi:MAG: preprotein translocase subunit SecA [Phycisphaeraceae bacterium]
MFVPFVSNLFRKIFGTRNDRLIKAYLARVALINEFEPQMRKLSDNELRAKTDEFRQRIANGTPAADIRPEALAVAREAMDRSVGIRNIFNPEHAFDPSKLPAAARKLYDETIEKIKTTEPVKMLGCNQFEKLVHAWDPIPAHMQVEVPVALYEAVRELHPKSRPPFRARPFDVQLIGGMVLSEGRISEMKTGEGKTIVAPLACYLASLEKLQCHVVTVNDYLVQRDRDWVFPFYYWLGLHVGAIHPYHMQPPQLKAEAYKCDVVYGTCSEFGFDYLRDNMKLSIEEQFQKHRDFAIVDEVDSILIDEARTPLIISGSAHDSQPRYGLADSIARQLMQKQRDWDAADAKVKACEMRAKGIEGDMRNTRDNESIPKMKEEMTRLIQEEMPELIEARDRHTQYYEVEREKKASHLTHDGIAEAQKIADIGSFYVGNNMDMPHLLENALRAHVIYQRDKDYVVTKQYSDDGKPEVVIIDENTGRAMVGRQWSDGLHQAVEAKERVPIKTETQTMATVTIQNYFKLYKRLAGMTGTAITESTEFNEIYKMDVVCIPTNVSVVRTDRDDLIFLAQKDKWNAILEEIKSKHDIGRPVLVGTTSVEKSEMLAELLRKRHGVPHEVLNAKQHEREAHIVEHAGELGAVMIATNMAGRGTDIKLQPIDRAALLRHWQMRNMLPKQAKPEMSDEELIALSYKHQAKSLLGLKPNDIDAMSDEEVRLLLLRYWVANNTYTAAAKAINMSEADCLAALDKVSGFALHRLKVYTRVEEMGGLHIIGTERHESRRIDNQLRGRAGRQGDRGSSRFFIGLDDELMQMFAGPLVLRALSKLGMKEGDSIEHRWITKSVERAQRKVEERNYEIRKQLVDYDEVMEQQRNAFYGVRQEVLAGHDVQRIVFDYITDSAQDAVDLYLERDYLSMQIAEWCRQTLDVSVEPTKLRATDLEELKQAIRADARAEAAQIVEINLGEFMSNEVPPDEWDLRGLSSWAMSKFAVNLTQNQLRQMNFEEVKTELTEAAWEQIDGKDITGVAKFLEKNYVQKQIADWAKQKFEIELDPEYLATLPPEGVAERIVEKARAMYEKREVEYPVEFALDMAFAQAQQNGDWAVQELCNWVKRRYELEWDPTQIKELTRGQMKEQMIEASRQWQRGGRLEALVDKAMAQHKDAESLAQWATERLYQKVEASDLENTESRRDVLLEKGRSMLRAELTQLERFVLLQILDTSWKDHLYAMDQLRDSVSMRSIADREKDPRVVYKREGAATFVEMQKVVRDRVTDLIFRARLTPQVEMKNVYENQQTQHDEAPSALERRGASQGTAEQQEDLETAERAGGGEGGRFVSRKQRRAAMAEQRRGGGKRPGDRKRR